MHIFIVAAPNMSGCRTSSLAFRHDTLDQIKNPEEVVEERGLFTLKSIPMVPVASCEVVAGTPTDHEIDSPNCIDELLELLCTQLLNVGKFNQISLLICLLPPTPQNVSVDLRDLDRHNILEGNPEPVEGNLSTSNSREKGQDFYSSWKEFLQN